MCVLSFSVELRGAVGDASVRVWLDDSRVRDLHSEVEVPLVRKRNRWTARFEARGADPGATFWLRLAMAGTPGADWQLEVREEGEAVPLLIDGDQLVMHKELFVATCRRGRRAPLSAVA